MDKMCKHQQLFDSRDAIVPPLPTNHPGSRFYRDYRYSSSDSGIPSWSTKLPLFHLRPRLAAVCTIVYSARANWDSIPYQSVCIYTINKALQLLTNEARSAPLRIDDTLDECGRSVRDILKDKHLHPEPPHPDVILKLSYSS